MSNSAQHKNISALTSAIDDIRHQLVEEPWFGQSTTDNIELPTHEHAQHEPAEHDPNTHHQSQNFESFYNIPLPESTSQAQNTQQQERSQHEQEL